MLRKLALMICCALPAQAEEQVVLGLSQNRVAITANFDGSEILVFGAVKREDPIPEGDPLEVVIAVSGPKEPLTVRRKERKYGIWVNTESVTVDRAPSFYAVATSGPFDQIVSEAEDIKHSISIGNAITSVSARAQSANGNDFAEAVARIRTNNGLYSIRENTVTVDQQTLFKASISMPANLTEGDYITRIFLMRDGKVISTHETQIDVRKVGLERFLFNLSRQQPLIYGLLSLAIAIIAGWGASAFFRYVRRGA
ncbi:TIGR02186 family protein [Cognatishimia sp. 1_MG-2023]|uniref:TIGR02186 family protein n=1 Tax=Cognatishimia sp. 1_MG-2023 TaxID=3062642 RepID=UPI0026E34DDA|nr:TIGR02186 family protein [Cognatishimia sp. 1_MG-2023]MDO6726157.1 TIGR02186 family protein [Cognatishimia sp. 1_MG-2023]